MKDNYTKIGVLSVWELSDSLGSHDTRMSINDPTMLRCWYVNWMRMVTPGLWLTAWQRCMPAVPGASRCIGGTVHPAICPVPGLWSPRSLPKPRMWLHQSESCGGIIVLGKAKRWEDLSDLLNQPRLCDGFLLPVDKEWARIFTMPRNLMFDHVCPHTALPVRMVSTHTHCQ